MNWKPKNEIEIGRITLDENNDLVVRDIIDDKDQNNIDIRIFVKTKNFNGFSGKGIYIPKSKLKKLIEILREISLE